jgi:hypothetical protein
MNNHRRLAAAGALLLFSALACLSAAPKEHGA